MKLTLLYPTRARPKQFAEVSKLWIHPKVELLVAVDEQDLPEYESYLKNMQAFVLTGPRLELDSLPISLENYLTAANKLNYLAVKSRGDWIGMVSDDLYCQPSFLDKLLEFLSSYSCKDKLCFSFDSSRQLVQHGIISRALHNELGFYDNPAFAHVYSDNYSWHLMNHRGYLRVIPSELASLVEHRHYSFGTAQLDDTYKVGNSEVVYKQGRETLDRLLKELYANRN